MIPNRTSILQLLISKSIRRIFHVVNLENVASKAGICMFTMLCGTSPILQMNIFRILLTFQKIQLTSQYKLGRTGNEVLRLALQQAKVEGIQATIYTHPLGLHGHAAGPAIGLWDQQGGVPGSGDYPIYYNTAYSIELNAASDIPEWKKSIRIMLEEDGYFDETGFRYINGRQRQLYLVPRTGGVNAD